MDKGSDGWDLNSEFCIVGRWFVADDLCPMVRSYGKSVHSDIPAVRVRNASSTVLCISTVHIMDGLAQAAAHSPFLLHLLYFVD